MREERNTPPPPPVRRIQQLPQPQVQQQQPLDAIQEENEPDGSEEEDPLGWGMLTEEPDSPPTQRRPQPEPLPQTERRQRHKCPHCQILLKLYSGERTCPCPHGGAPTIRVDREGYTMDVHDQRTDENLGEVAYTRGLSNHPLGDLPEVAAITTACLETGVLMSPSDTSSSNQDGSEDGDDEASCHGFTSSPDTPDHYDNMEEEPMYAVILHHIQSGGRRHTSTRDDLLDTDEEPLLDSESAEEAQAPPQDANQEGVQPDAPTTPPQQSATSSEDSPLHIQMRSGRIKMGAPKKKGGGTKGRT